MTQRILTIDLGNSRCKLCVLERAPDGVLRPLEEEGFATTATLAHEVAVFARRHADAHLAALSCVGPRAIESAVSAVLADVFEKRFLDAPDPQLDSACSPPEAVGRDRLYAARAAIERAPLGAIVVDAGTALTVDAVAPQSAAPHGVAPHAARPRFLGGAIAPGPHLLADALARHAARLPLVVPRPRAHALGRDTQSALQSGIVVGFRGSAAELARRVAVESGLESAPVVVTGGARAFLLEPESCFSARTLEEPLLVHHGLAWSALAAR